MNMGKKVIKWGIYIHMQAIIWEWGHALMKELLVEMTGEIEHKKGGYYQWGIYIHKRSFESKRNSTGTAGVSIGIADNPEGCPDEFFVIVNSAAFQVAQRKLIHNNPSTLSLKHPDRREEKECTAHIMIDQLNN